MDPDTFKKITEKWYSLMKPKDFEAANKVYWEELFPLVQEKFLRETQERIEKGEVPKYDCIVMPIALYPKQQILIINAFRPKKVYFLCSVEGEKHLDEVVKRTGLTQDQYIKDTIEYWGMDVAGVYEKIRKRLNLFKGEKVAIDLSRGKRIFSAGAAIVGAFFGCDLIYVDEEWLGEIQMGAPGTEKLVCTKNPLYVFGELEEKYAIQLFNRYDYTAAANLFDALHEKVQDPRKYEVKTLISNAYAMWDSFNYKAALELLTRANGRIEQYSLDVVDLPQLKNNLVVLNHLEKTQSFGEGISLLKDEHLMVHLLVDIYCNGGRRAKQNRFEDAIVRLYRVIELISQHRLAKVGIDTNSPDYSVLPTTILADYKKISKELFNEEKNSLPSKIALIDGHTLLYLLKDKLWDGKSNEDIKKLIKAIETRNHSVIAHGVNLIGQKIYNEFRDMAKEMIARVCKLQDRDFELIYKYHTHLKLSGE